MELCYLIIIVKCQSGRRLLGLYSSIENNKSVILSTMYSIDQ